MVTVLLSILFLSPAAPAEVKHPDTYTYMAILEPNSLDPAWAYDSASLSAIRNIYEPLFVFEGPAAERLAPLLAGKVPARANGLISADGRTYRIPIRKGVKFHDGTPMTPEDVRYSLLRFLLFDRDGGPSTLLLQPLLGYGSTRDESGKPRAAAFKDAARAVSVEGDELVLRLPKPFAPLLSILASWSPVVSKRWVAANGGWDGAEATWTRFSNPDKQSSVFFERTNGTGPFKLERWDRRTKELLLIRNDDYWRKPARLKRVRVRTSQEFATRKLALQAGDADGIYAERAVLSQVQAIPGVRVIDELPSLGLDLALFTFELNPTANTFVGSGKLDGQGIPPDFFADKDVRRAFAYAFDYQGYMRDVQRGKGSQPNGAIPKGLLGHDPKLPFYSFDLARAKEHFQKAFGGKAWQAGFRFTLAYNSGNNERATVCQILKRNVESLNPKFNVDVRAVEWPTFIDAVRADKIPFYVTGWGADYPDPHNFAFPLLHSEGGYPRRQKYRNPKADALIAAALHETDPAKRRKLYVDLQRLEYEDVPHILILEPVNFRIQRDWVKGWQPNMITSELPYGGYFYPLYKAE